MIKRLKTYIYDNFYDKKFSGNKKKYIFQCFAATLIVYFVLTSLSLISSDLVIASIASTSFLVFSAPHSERSKMRYIIGGYTVGFAIGVICYYLMQISIDLLPMLQLNFDEVWGAIAIGLSIFVMVVIDVEHPPASAACLAMVINHWNIWTILVTMVAVFILILSRYLLRPYLIQLI